MENTMEINKEKTIRRFRNEILEYVASSVRYVLEKMDKYLLGGLEEIRLRANRPLMIETSDEEGFVNLKGEVTKYQEGAYIVKQKELTYTLELMCENSIYAFQHDINRGFITLRGGHRVGITGKAVIDNRRIVNIKELSGINIRISREQVGCGSDVVKKIIRGRRDIYNTLIISPPQCGKTTMLRDLSRIISNGVQEPEMDGLKVGIVDERSELAACYQGVPQNDIGIRTDVLDSCSKQEGIEMLLRTMSPNVIVVDELGNPGDVEAVINACNAGVRILATAHGYDISDIKHRNYTRWLVESSIFERYIILDADVKKGKIKEVFGGEKSEYGTSN